MRIHTKVVFDMETLAIIEDESTEYVGEVAQCGKGGGGGGGGGDAAAMMMNIALEQQGWAREYFNVWNNYYKPYEIEQVQANRELLPYEKDLYKGQLIAGQNLLPLQEEALTKFMEAGMKGVDVNERVGMATADASAAWKDAQAANNRAMARLGVNPNSGRYQGLNAATNIQKSAQLGATKTQARVGAEQENFNRLGVAANLNPVAQVLSGSSAIKG